MAGIFVSYRRSDSQGEAGRLFDDLTPLFGEHAVFMDVSAIEAGRDFRKAIEEGVTKCGVLLVVIGPEWLNAKDETGASRLNNPADFVRLETSSALKRDIPVIPVLVRAARMPTAEQLPDDLKELAYRNCVELTHARWKSDLELLVEALRRLLGSGDVTTPQLEPADQLQPLEQASATSLDPAALQRVTRELGVYLGQIAGIVVKRAASQSASIEDLCLKVAEEIDSPAERAKFLSGQSAVSRHNVTAANPASSDPSSLRRDSSTPEAKSKSVGKGSAASGKYLVIALGGGILLVAAGVLGIHFAGLKSMSQTHAVAPPPQAAQNSPPENPPQPVQMLQPAPVKVESARVEPPPATLPPSRSQEPETTPQRVSLSQDVSQGLLINKVLPIYPPLASQAHIQGEVVLEVDISTEGTIETLKEVSGHPMLVPAAIEAAKQFRYKPYALNGKPVAVTTQITVKFSLLGN
jgi:TonB family protein